MVVVKNSVIKINSLLLAFTFIFSFNQVIFANTIAKSDSIKKKGLNGLFFLSWGYNRNWYSKSDIRIQNSNPQLINGKYYTYDFTVYNATASDRPDFDQIKDVANITIPQFGFRVGYFFNNKQDFGIEINYDHAKYVVNNYQKVRVKGQINGDYFDKDTILDPDNFLHFEHTDGANFWMINFIKRWKLIESKNKKHNIGLIVKPGFGIVYPRTDVTIFGNRINNQWKISGIIAGVEAGLRVEFLKNGFLEFTGKGAYANYINAIVQGKGYGKASHKFWVAEAILMLGYQFKLKK